MFAVFIVLDWRGVPERFFLFFFEGFYADSGFVFVFALTVYGGSKIVLFWKTIFRKNNIRMRLLVKREIISRRAL